jgi:hypothetical protein
MSDAADAALMAVSLSPSASSYLAEKAGHLDR